MSRFAWALQPSKAPTRTPSRSATNGHSTHINYRSPAQASPGRVKGSAEISLRQDGDGTVVEYLANVAAQGALARLGNRLVGGAAKLLASQFFRSMEKQVANRGL